QDVRLQTDGKILIQGAISHTSPYAADVLVTDVVLVRLNADGSMDTSFSEGGILLPRDIDIEVFAVQADNEILIIGGSLMTRYLADGSLDTNFGSGGHERMQFRAGVSAAPV